MTTKRSGMLMQVSVIVLLIGLVGLGAGGLYSYSSSSSNLYQPGSGSQNEGNTRYLGPNLPAGYQLSPLLPSAQAYPCPSNYNSTQCTQFKTSCGNGVCDPNETCGSCPIDCGVPQGLSCDPYTGRASGLGGICEIYIPYNNVNPCLANPTLNGCQTPQG